MSALHLEPFVQGKPGDDTARAAVAPPRRTQILPCSYLALRLDVGVNIRSIDRMFTVSPRGAPVTQVQSEDSATVPAPRSGTGRAGPRIVALDCLDIRFPTSLEHDGSDAMNPDPDYSAAYAVLRTDDPDGLEGHALSFTIGRGNEVLVTAIQALRAHVVGRFARDIAADLGGFSAAMIGDSQL